MSDLDQLWRSTARQNRTVVDSIKHLSYIGRAPASRRALLYASFIRYHHRRTRCAGRSTCLSGRPRLSTPAQTAGTAQTPKAPRKWASSPSVVLTSQTAGTAQTSPGGPARSFRPQGAPSSGRGSRKCKKCRKYKSGVASMAWRGVGQPAKISRKCRNSRSTRRQCMLPAAKPRGGCARRHIQHLAVKIPVQSY